LDTMPHPHFHGKKSSYLKTLSGVSGFSIIHYGSTPTALSFSTKVSNSSCAFAFTVAGKDRLILLIIIVNCRLFVHSKRHRTDHQYRICCLFHFVFFLCSTITRYIYTKITD
jgi:hypothetical protein